LLAKMLPLFRKPRPTLGVCCHCGKEIFEGDDLVTIVAAEFDRLRAHRDCHFYRRSGVTWPENQ